MKGQGSGDLCSLEEGFVVSVTVCPVWQPYLGMCAPYIFVISRWVEQMVIKEDFNQFFILICSPFYISIKVLFHIFYYNWQWQIISDWWHEYPQGNGSICNKLMCLKKLRHHVCVFWTFSKSSFPIRFNLLHPQLSSFLYALESTFLSFSSCANHYFYVSQHFSCNLVLKEMTHNIATYM